MKLNNIEPTSSGYLPEEEYFEHLQKFPTYFRELIDFVETENGPEVLLELRSPNDKFYSGKYATHGSTVLMRETFDTFAKRHSERESGILFDIENSPHWNYCGLISTPLTIRQHGCVEVFARSWKTRPAGAVGEWYIISELKNIEVVESIKEVIALASGVLYKNQNPQFLEFLGTDE